MGFSIKLDSSLSFWLVAATVSLGIRIFLTKTNKRKTKLLKQTMEKTIRSKHVTTLEEGEELKFKTFEEGWDLMQKGITKLKNRLEEGDSEPLFSLEEKMMLYTTIFDMCVQKPPHDYSKQLYDKYRECFEEYITSTVLPSLREKHDEFMLRELVRRWSNHKVMVRWLCHFFHYLNRYFIPRRQIPTLYEVALACFRDLVYTEVNKKVRDVVISLINQERKGKKIDRDLLKNVVDIFVEIGRGELDYYEIDFESSMLIDASSYYSSKASKWIVEDSCPNYMLKAGKCLKNEKDRVLSYLDVSSEPKLLKIVRHELLSVYATQLLEKEQSGCHALFRDEKVVDLSRMYRLFSKIPGGLDPVSNMFKQHVITEGTTLVKQAEDDSTNEKVLVKRVIELHDKYLAYVIDCFDDDTLFHKALKEALDIFCNKDVAGNFSAELLATFRDNILKKDMSDEAIEDTPES